MRSESLGLKGERLAEKYLRKRGYRILARNYRCPLGEIDLIAFDGEVVVFVEVKGKSSNLYGSGLDAVTPRKRERLILVARHYLASFSLNRVKTRFDVVGVRWRGGEPPELIHVRDAFRSPR